MLRKRKSPTQVQGSLIERSLARLPLLNKTLPGPPVNLQDVGLLVDIFAAFAILDGKVAQSEANIALDLLRHAYPEADHGWLARRLQRAFRKTPTLDELAASARPLLSAKQCASLALQLFLLVHASSQRAKGKQSFLHFIKSLGHEDIGTCIVDQFDGSCTSPMHPLIERVCFGNEAADIHLPKSANNLHFTVYRASQVIVLRNSGKHSLTLAGMQLIPDTSTRLRPHQRLAIPDWGLTHADFEFFLNAQTSQQQHIVFVGKSNDVVLAERNRSRNSIFKITYGLKVTVEALRASDYTLSDGNTIKPDAIIDATHFGHLKAAEDNPISLNQLRLQAMDSGSRFRFGEKKQTLRISNDPNELSEGGLKLSPGLAEPVLLEVTFDQQKGVGQLKVLRQGKHPVLVNHIVASASTTLQDGCLIRVSPNQGVRCRFSEGLLDEERTIIQQLRVDGISHLFGNSVALDNIEFSLQRGEMLCIMGPSGSGKSTLLSAIAGQLAPTRGHLRLNEISLYRHHARLSRFITYMPQEEALSSQLTVREHLQYAIKIRQPNLNTQEIQHRVDTILDELSLQPLAGRKVGSPDDKSLSGGERSRLNLGLDLGSQAEIFLFDEPISGLSSKDSEHVAESLKSISRDKIVIASLHRPSATILSQFDKVLLLDNGGRVAFFGTPMTMRNYFTEASQDLQINITSGNNQNSADYVFDVLETPYIDRVNSHSFESTRRFPPLFWQERFESYSLYKNVEKGDVPAQTNIGDLPRSDDNMPIPKKGNRRPNEYFRIFKAHFWRATLSKYRNKGTIYATLLEVPLLAFIIAWTLRASAEGSYEFETGLHIVTYLFMAVTVGMFLGLTNSATEILRDRPTLRRERNCRYNDTLYVLSKFSSLALLSAVQAAIFITIGNWMLEIHGMWLNHWLWMTLTAMSGTAIALFISSVVKSERAALSAVPLILVPQLLLAGTPLIPFEEMNRGLFSGAEGSRNNGIEPIPSRIIPLRYAYEGITVNQATENYFELARRKIDNAAQTLKKEKDFAITYSNEGLSETKSERLAVLLRGLTLLYALEAPTEPLAREKVRVLLETSLNGSMEELKSVEIRDEEVEHPSCASYYVNERANQLVLKQDIQRVDLSKDEEPNIFLAEKKYFGDKDNPDYLQIQQLLRTSPQQGTKINEDIPATVQQDWKTTFLCRSVLAMLSILLLVATTFIVAKSNRKKR